MSSFICEICGKEIIDTLRGYVTACEHYPLENFNWKSLTYTINIPIGETKTTWSKYFKEKQKTEKNIIKLLKKEFFDESKKRGKK